jgi:hypothetical protein
MATKSAKITKISVFSLSIICGQIRLRSDIFLPPFSGQTPHPKPTHSDLAEK